MALWFNLFPTWPLLTHTHAHFCRFLVFPTPVPTYPSSQSVVEKKLARERKQTRHDLGRENFVAEVRNIAAQ
jgi:hypothetical protein